MSAACSPIMNVATIGLTVGMVGKIEPSAIDEALDAAHAQLRVDHGRSSAAAPIWQVP